MYFICENVYVNDRNNDASVHVIRMVFVASVMKMQDFGPRLSADSKRSNGGTVCHLEEPHGGGRRCTGARQEEGGAEREADQGEEGGDREAPGGAQGN